MLDIKPVLFLVIVIKIYQFFSELRIGYDFRWPMNNLMPVQKWRKQLGFDEK
jgi:hypothetical protein